MYRQQRGSYVTIKEVEFMYALCTGKLKLNRPLFMSGWNKRHISNWPSAGYLKRVQFYNWFRLHQILYQLQTVLGGAMHPLCELSYWTNVSIGKENKIVTKQRGSYVTIKEVEFMYALCTGNKEVLTSLLKKLSSCMLYVQATKRR